MVKVTVPHEDILLNSEDTIYIQRRSVTHVVDKDTHYQAAKFLRDDSIEATSKTFMQIQCLIHLGFPDSLRHNQSTQFFSSRFR